MRTKRRRSCEKVEGKGERKGERKEEGKGKGEDHRELRNSKRHKIGHSAHCRIVFAQTDIRFRFLRFSIIKKCPHMLKSDHRDLRNSKGKFTWWVFGMEGIIPRGS